MAALALAAACGCSDTFPPAAGPADRFYFPTGLAVRRLPDGQTTALLVVSSNFDLLYDFDVGGTVLAVDPDASAGASLAVLGHVNIASFCGEIDYAQGFDYTAGLPGQVACEALLNQNPPHPIIEGGGAYLVTASRAKQLVYRIAMDASGSLACDGCARPVAAEALDPYGVAVACKARGGDAKAKAYVTHLQTFENVGRLTELDLVTGQVTPGPTPLYPTYSSTFDPVSGRLYVSTRRGSVDLNPLSWFDVLAPVGLPSVKNVSEDVRGALPRGMALSQDGRTGYLSLELFDRALALRIGLFASTGGAIAVYDLSETALGQPAMRLMRLVPTCAGSGQIRRIGRPGKRDLLAVTCDSEGVLVLYDDDVGAVVARIGLDESGRPRLGRQPFGLAVEPRQNGRTRLYVGSFDRSFVSLVELDPAAPSSASIVKRIGRERE